jgi:hypothetical protein
MTQDRFAELTAPASPTPASARSRRTSLLGVLAATLVAGCASSVAAPESYPSSEVVDPPARVGSISALRGPVDASFEAGGAWEPAKLNWPVTTGSALWAPPGSQAEVRIGSASVRLDGNTQAVFQKLDDDEVAIDVAQGTVRARLRRLEPGESFVMVADGVRAEAQGPGDYRVSYDPDRRAYTVRALAGRMRIATPGNSFNLEAGQESIVEGGGASLALRAMGPRDDFDAWAEARDREQDRLAAARYVSPETTGIEALDAHGRWEIVGEYGPVWYPRAVPYGWAPYRYGHWAWVRPWGWTWVDDAPWGFAPFHYGRWSQFGGVWGWVPGPIVPRPVWAPALVGYVGGGGVSVSIGIGGGRPVGWFPLGPREVYYPGYRYSPRYAQRINIVNVHPIAPPPRDGRWDDRWANRQPVPGVPAYRYANRPDAVTIVREDQFRGARPIGGDRMNLTPQQAAGLQPVLVPPRVQPSGRTVNSGPSGPDGRPSPRGDFGRGDFGRGDGSYPSDRVDRAGRGMPGQTNPAPPFERGPSTGRDLIPGAPGSTIGRPPTAPPEAVRVMPSSPPPEAVRVVPSSPPPAQPAAPDPRGYGGRGDPRFSDERNFDRGSFGRGMPQPARPAPEAPPRAAAPAPTPVPQAAPRPAPPVQPAPRGGREAREGREEGEGPKFWRGVGTKER